MKNLSKLILGLLLTSVIFTGCKEAEEIFYVNFDANYETEFEVVVPPSGGKMGVDKASFSVVETIDPSTNSDYEKYIDNIKEVNIQEVTGEVLTITKNVKLLTGTITVSNSKLSPSWTFSNIPIEVGTVLTLDNENGQWDDMTDIMLDKTSFTVNIAGEVDDDDVTFTVLFKVDSKVIASPL